MKIASKLELQEMDRRVQEEFAVPGLVLMENAALRVVDFLMRRYSPLKGKNISVICGRGNNGGDGLAIARQLHSRFEAKIIVWLASAPGFFQGEAAASYAMAKSFGVDLRSAASLDLSDSNLIIDAIFGSGLQGAVVGECARIIELMNASGKPIISVDIPSGLHADGSEIIGAVVRATTTVSFILPKYGMLEFPGAEYSREIVIENICFLKKILSSFVAQSFSVEASDIGNIIPIRLESIDSNKKTYGHCVIVAGSEEYSGAAILAAEAAMRCGAGLVHLVVPESIFSATMARISPEVILSSLQRENIGAILKSANCVGVGPGLANNSDTENYIKEMIQSCMAPMLLDAGALQFLANLDDQGQSLLRSRKASTILTPHPGEMGRLLQVTTQQVQANRRGAVQEAAKKYSCTVVLKGARTVTADVEAKVYINTNGNPGMATAGNGDILSGIIAGLLAQKIEALAAAYAGVFIHGLAGDFAAKRGMTGLNACDVLQHVPEAITFCQTSIKN